MEIRPIRWQNGRLLLLDQRVLPVEERWIELSSWQEVADAIRDMVVRGAPAIGVTAAYGMVLAAQHGASMKEAHDGLAASRPTAVNLFWALERIAALPSFEFKPVLAEAQAIEEEDVASNKQLALHGATLIPHGARILTICNTGSLATAGHGTALGVIRTAFEQKKEIFVYSCETRPRQQGLRLTAWELMKENIRFQSIPDGAAGSLMRDGKVDLVIAGADRIAANGDTANKIGTYSLAVLAKYHNIPFYIAAPFSTFDLAIRDGGQIPIEERSANELTQIEGVQVAPVGCPVYNPAFDVTPGELIDAIITERGLFNPPYSFAEAEHRVSAT